MPYFTFTDASDETFVVHLTDPAQVAHARGLIAGTETGDFHIGGTLTKAPAAYNIGWSFHIAPQNVFFYEMSAEVGDSTMRYIEEHLGAVGGALLPGSVWTGWSTHLVGELNLVAGGNGTDLLIGTDRDDLILGRGGTDLLVGQAGNDHMAGGSGTDLLDGGTGDDKLDGRAGTDLVVGGNGRDLLIGGAGDDLLVGGAGDDVFQIVSADRAGREVVADFHDGDRIRIDRSWLQGLDDVNGDGRINRIDLAAAFETRGDNLVLRHDAETVLVLRHAAGDGVQPSDFLLTG